MDWRYIKAALICGVLGFIGQFIGDFFCYRLDNRGLTAYKYSVSPSSQQVAMAPYRSADRAAASRMLWQLLFLGWLYERSEVAVRSAAIVALLGVSAIMGADQIRARRKAHRETTVL